MTCARARRDAFTAESPLGWDVDWTNFTDEYPGVPGDAETWKRRLALALDRGAATMPRTA
ncbi:hypothetical protein [Micromonospora sagamiensis]|uniref:hypothetical protein n=1 Tax=Micromonospora sagamiensis TaxID=47875 RepID=UPI00119CC484|nr:hypothetical protein [Micromonospora sagamiensis]